jgi:RHS repeat-associated protein
VGWTDTTGTLKGTALYDPWGQVLSSTGEMATVPAQGAFGFQSDLTDTATGQVDMGVRAYEPTLGRFSSPDPLLGELTDPISLNRYLYGGASPITYADPTGLKFIGADGGGGGTGCGRICQQTLEDIEQLYPGDGAGSPAPPGMSNPSGFAVVSPGLVLSRRSGHLLFLNEGDGLNVGGIQGLLDVLGFIPGPGDILDAINGLISLARGDLAGAGLSALALIPLVGSPLKAALRYSDEAGELLRMSDDAAGFLGRGPANTYVYRGLRDETPVYVGITNNPAGRQLQHGDRFLIDPFGGPITRGQARAIEQAEILRNPQFENIRNSISPLHGFYADVVGWGEAWLKANLGGM